MVEKKISQKFRLKNKNEARDNLIEEVKQIDLTSKKTHTKIYVVLNCINHLF